VSLSLVNRSKFTKGQNLQTYETLKPTTWECKYHVVFIAKCRKKSLFGQIRRDLAKQEPDLAVLSIATPLDHFFEWASEFTNATPVMAVGLSYNDHSRVIKTQCMAGKILNLSARSATTMPFTVISDDSPLRRGDSGGPLVLSDGRLIGINVSETLDFKVSQLSFEPAHSEANRPNLAWLREIIDKDAPLKDLK